MPALAPADEPLITGDAPTVTDRARRRVETDLLEPLAKRERRSRFSRLQPPDERRVRITNPALSTDRSGRAFLPFALDIRYGSEWIENDGAGCVYPPNGDIFVKVGDAYRPARILLGKKADAVTGVCEAASLSPAT
jgi:hypothetical protein